MMTDFKHVEEQIAWLRDSADGPNVWEWGQGKPLDACANTMQALLDRNKELEAALTEGEKWKERCESLASFNPNWDMLEATQESLREHMLRIKELEALLDDVAKIADEVKQYILLDGARYKLQDALAKLQEQNSES
jgi:DNA repair exonuclease SbcCD ATPase subunit